MKNIFTIFIFVFFALNIKAQEKVNQKKKKLPKNIEAIDSKFSFSPIFYSEYSFFQIKSRKNAAAGEMKYKPNIIESVGAKVGIKNISFSYLHAIKLSEQLGKTKSTNLVFNFQRRIFGMQLFWINYQGLYIDTLDRYRFYNDMYINRIDSAIIIRPDIKFNNIGFKNYFVFRKSFSVNAAVEQTERQKKTAGSFMLTYGGNFINVENSKDQSLILLSQKDYFPKTYDIYKLNAIAFKIAPGIGYSFIMRKYFNLSFIFLAGPSLQFKWYSLENSNMPKFGRWVSVYYEGKAAFGYNGRVFMANIIYARSQDVLGFNKSYKNKEYNCKTNYDFFRESLKLSIGFRIY